MAKGANVPARHTSGEVNVMTTTQAIETKQLEAFARQLNHERLAEALMAEAQAIYLLGHNERDWRRLVLSAKRHDRLAKRYAKEANAT